MKEKYFQQDLSYDVWYNTYKWETDQDLNDTFNRLARFIASNEKSPDKWEKKYFDLLIHRKYVPGGRIISNAGTGLKGTCFINCFVDGFTGPNQDSLDSIYNELKKQAMILKSEGGYGFCVDSLRPRGSYIHGIGIDSPGAVEFLNLWDSSSAVITSGSGISKKAQKGKNKIRKGAMMVTMSCCHPGIEEFITAKRTPNRLTKFNMSVLIYDEFMEAVKNNQKWQLWFPKTDFEKYDAEWDGNFQKWKEKGYPYTVYKEYENAGELWDLIMKSTYDYNEPGVIFIDRANHLNNLWYNEYFKATNPCGEQLLPNGGSCNLGSINLTQYVNKDKTDYDYDALAKDLPVILRFQDSINDVTEFPLPHQRDEAQNKRRVGLGYMGYGSSLYMMKIPYGSPRGLEITERMVKFVTNTLYQSSSGLAKEKGPFPLFDQEKFLQSNFVKQALSPETIEMIRQNGLRNSHLTTVAPTGNTSVFSNNVSSGLEPVIYYEYIRTSIVGQPPEGLTVPQNVDWSKTSYEGPAIWKFISEGKDTLLKTEFNGMIYKFDQNRGLTCENKVYDYAVFNNREEFYQDLKNNADYIKNITNLNVDDHVNVMAAFMKYIDSSASKTINIPNNYSYQDFKNVYMKAYDTRVIKGVTTYRDGTMANVIKIGDSEKSFDPGTAAKRPKVLEADVHRISANGEEWIVFVGLHQNKVYEVFAGKINLVDIPKRISKVNIIKKGKGVYQIEYEDEVIIKDINKVFENNVYEGITRLLSTAMRHNVPLQFILDQMSKAKGSIASFEKAIMRALKNYVNDGIESSEKCPNCNNRLTFMEGCKTCLNCNWSKCT